MENLSFFEKLNSWIANSITVKFISIGILILLLLIPMSMIENLIYERERTQQSAINEVSDKWGHAQTIIGPILKIPYRTYYKTKDGDGQDRIHEQIEEAYFLPEELSINGKIEPEMRHRGLYEVVVYQSSIKIEGSIKYPDFQDWNIDQKDIIWSEASLSVGIPDMRGIQEKVALSWNADKLDFNPGVMTPALLKSGIHRNVEFKEDLQTYQFSLDIVLNGSRNLSFVPLGKETNVSIVSPWADPSFMGAFLPDSHSVSADGFEAQWKVLHLNRNFPQKWRSNAQNFQDASFGVDLLLPVDKYQKSIRSAKYAMLFIGLTFLVFFFVEIKNKIRIHPFQYILVGLALCVFYALLLSLSEHMLYGSAYALASVGVIGIITAYSTTVFHNRTLVMSMSGVLIMLYIFLYIILKSQDYLW